MGGPRSSTSFIPTRIVLWVTFITNVITLMVGLSLFERVQKIVHTSELREKSQTEDLNRIYRLLADTNERVNSIQIELQHGHIATQIDDIDSRVNAIQIAISASRGAK